VHTWKDMMTAVVIRQFEFRMRYAQDCFQIKTLSKDPRNECPKATLRERLATSFCEMFSGLHSTTILC
jgi:hypothetical protein